MVIKKYEKIIIFLFLIFIGFIGTEMVNAEWRGEGNTSSFSACNTIKDGFCWLDLEGIRISFYHKDGRKIGRSLNFYNSDKNPNKALYDNYKNYQVYQSNLNGSKLDYTSFNTYLPSYKSWNKISISSVFSGGIDFFQNLYGSGLVNNIFQETIGIYDENTIKQALKPYENEFFGNSITFEQMLSKEQKANYYMIVEPITIIYRNSNEMYLGTYYELQQIFLSFAVKNGYRYRTFGGAHSIFEYYSKNPGFAMSIYLPLDNPVNGSGKIADLLNNFAYTKEDWGNSKNRYGIGTMWFGDFNDCDVDSPEWNPLTNTCGNDSMPLVPNEDQCTVKQTVKPCEDGVERIVYEYYNCPLNKKSSVKDDEITGDTICQIQCNEKYYIATWQFNSIFESNSGGILAGTYFSINGPTVWHKKTCEYVDDIKNFERNVKSKKASACYKMDTCECKNPSASEPCYCRVIDQECLNEWDAYMQEKIDGCTNLNNDFDRMDSEKDAKNDQLGGGTLTLFSEYQLESSKVGEPEYNFDGYSYGYKNMFIYNMTGNSNQYINMNTISEDNENNVSNSNYDNGSPMATTPINADPNNVYFYSLQFENIFSDSFKNVLTNKDINISKNITWSCPYKIIGRNNNYNPLPCYKNCDNPDDFFGMLNLKMVYRPISLSVPFPGRNYIGIQREAGSNWTEEAIDTYITNNRGVVEDEVYNKDPIYVINLDSSTIKAIREYNKNNSYDDFTLSCTAGKGTECISNFLRNYERDYNLFIEDTACSKIKAPDSSGIPNLEFYTCLE